MGRRFKKLVWVVLSIVILFILAAVGSLLFLTLTQFTPSPVENLSVSGNPGHLSPGVKSFTVLTWNIGYAGLGQEMDFFYEGGTKVKPPKDEFDKYLGGIKSFLSSEDSVDFLFLQEIDIHSKRSYYTDELLEIAKGLPFHGYAYATNYNSKFVPVPVVNPMGRVLSGIATFTGFQPSSAVRMDYGTRFPWPDVLFMSKRCFIVMRIPFAGGKELVLVNTHNSVFDKGGVLRKKELKILQEFLKSEFEKGNYVFAGGDWNHNPRGFDPGKIRTGDRVRKYFPPIDPVFLPGWQFVFDSLNPTNRDVNESYRKGHTTTTILDFFVISPNLKVEWVKTIPMDFIFSDHNPVITKIRLK